MTQVRILLVDDSAIDRMFMRTSIEGLPGGSWKVDEADGGASALEAMQRARYDAVMLDLRMPGQDGIEVLRSIRDRQDGTWPLVLMCSSSDHPTDVSSAYAAHANAYLCKPDSMEGYARLAESFQGLLQHVCGPQSCQRG